MSSGSMTTLPVAPSMMTGRPAYSALRAPPTPTMAGMPMVRARMAVWLDPEPPAVMKPRILDLSSWTVSEGARSSAARMTGTSEAMPPATAPDRMSSSRRETSFTSAARACM